jgi:hypothetical protein
MNSQDVLPFSQWATVHRTERVISIEPLSGYAIIQREDDGYVINLAPSATDEEMGRALLEVLDRSRFIWPPDPAFSEAERYMRCFRNWQAETMRRYGYKTKRDFYKHMDWCRIRRTQGKISIQPHKRGARPEHWEDLPREMDVVIPETNDASAVGAALRLALERCE